MNKGKIAARLLGLGALAGAVMAYDAASKHTRLGDRKDAKLIRSSDPLHFIMPNIIPNRADNEAYISQRIDVAPLKEYVAKKNAENPEYEYTIFQLLVVAVLKTVILRPRLNNFIAGGNYYKRNKVTAGFTVKKVFDDDSEEAFATVQALPSDNLETIHEKLYKTISVARSEESDSTSEAMGVLNDIPRFISKTFVKLMRFMDNYGLVPQALIETDPYRNTVLLANLGSIGLKSGYHHLTNYGTTSIFVIMGEMKMTPEFDEKGNVTMKETVDLGLTVDERIADGYYYSGSVRLLTKILENPEILEMRLDEKIEY